MNKNRIFFLSLFFVFVMILSSCGVEGGAVGLELPSSRCNKEIVFDTQIKFVFPNLGPLSVGVADNGVFIQEEVTGVEAEQYIGVPPPFEGFRCLTLIVWNQSGDNESEHVAIYFQEGYKLRIRTHTENTTEFVFSSGRMAVSPGYDKPYYIEYDYLTDTLTIDATNRQVEYFVIKADTVLDEENIWFCSRQLGEGAPVFLVFSNIFAAWFRDLTNKLRDGFLNYGSIAGTLWFWLSFFVIVGTSFYLGGALMKKIGWISILLLWLIIPIITTIVYMHVLFYNPNCPIV